MEIYLSLFWVLLGIGILMVLNLKYKLHNLLSLIMVGIFVAFMEGMSIEKIVSVIQAGLGSILGHLALIIIFGAVIGRIMTDSGASQKIADTVIARCGKRYLPIGLMFIGMIFGIAMFYEVAFLIAVPLIINIAKKANIPYMKLVIPTVIGATVGHSLFPPQPGPVALVSAFGVDMTQMYIFGFIVAVPAIAVGGLLLPKILPGLEHLPLRESLEPKEIGTKKDLPSFGISILIPLIPAILMITASVVKMSVGEKTDLGKICNFIGSAEISMLLATLAAMYLLGYRRGMNNEQMGRMMNQSIASISDVLIVISAGGILKQVIIDTGVGDKISELAGQLPVSPLIIAWLITAIIRILTGQGAVAAITAAGIVAPMIATNNINPALMALAVACGSNTMTMMYDGGFLLFKETFGISMKDTFKTWGGLELANSVVGLSVVLILSLFIH
ncbi:gluconate:H+ symporter [Lactococcus chungangensis]|jgi:gluconate transporter|uniref:Gnt-II system L-idonate transporter IdnT n=1 Tax=Pseudolactococcus chungangensis CAU 28 = DSM 22330 TaxID=1122154 RepID=A0A1K2HFJ7_9LACT|nr:gluconate:H+ symporter [Lactococcus chungangensis]MDD3015581.1 gluconate:H+ symporter [Lactococcus chungangensis]NCB81423.1 gluconate permease [Bacilli bacterium]PCS03358.1 Gnt-II system L-idonate transporter IdnT [Lactococcus chungangensis CAU 28 = DSM 22330]SFZ75313.1 high-affinity gluconate transporter [Lactococcus chungangensis CAU 28 = DSM 22330]